MSICSAAADWSRNCVAYLGCFNVNDCMLGIYVPVHWSTVDKFNIQNTVLSLELGTEEVQLTSKLKGFTFIGGNSYFLITL